MVSYKALNTANESAHSNTSQQVGKRNGFQASTLPKSIVADTSYSIRDFGCRKSQKKIVCGRFNYSVTIVAAVIFLIARIDNNPFYVRTPVKSRIVNLLYRTRHKNRLQPWALPKVSDSQFSYRIRNNKALQWRTARKRRSPHACHRIRELYRLQTCTIKERTVSNAFHGIGNRYRHQTWASLKETVSDSRHLVRQFYRLQARTAIKHLVTKSYPIYVVKLYPFKRWTPAVSIISWLSVLYALNGRKVTVWILYRYEMAKI